MVIDNKNDHKEGDGAIPILIKTRMGESLGTDGDTGQSSGDVVVSVLRSECELFIKKELDRLASSSSVPRNPAASCHNPDVFSRDAILRWVWKSQENFFRKSAIELAYARIAVLESSLERLRLAEMEVQDSSRVTVDGVLMSYKQVEKELLSLDDRVYSLRPADLYFTASEYRLQLVRAAQAVFEMITADPSVNAVLTDEDRRMLQKILDSSTTCDEL